MGRYVKKFTRVGSAGPTEERGFAIWAGYDLEGVDADLSHAGLVNVDGWTDERIGELGVVAFMKVAPDDQATYEKLGIRRNR
jgi:hypothetical protein